MITKEIIEAKWKIIVGIAASLIIAIGITALYEPMAEALSMVNTEDIPEMFRKQFESMFDFSGYLYMQWFGGNAGQIFTLLAAIMGGTLIASEVSKGSIFFLLGRPLSRDKILLSKYAVSAVALLIVVLLGTLGVWATASIMGKPQSAGGMLWSTLLIWLGSLFVLGIALIASTLSRDIVKPIMIAIGTAVILGIPSYFSDISNWGLTSYWANIDVYLGKDFPLAQLIVCFVSAILPLAIAIPLFRKQAY